MIYKRICTPANQSFFLFGPRGVGKSTWAQSCFPRAHCIDLLDETLHLSYLSDSELFAAEMRALPSESWVIIDEVQRIPSLLNSVHRFIEGKRMRFVLLGSSARKLKTSGTNLLAGRALVRRMYPLVPEEMGADFSIEQLLISGSIALIHQSENRKEALRAYVELYLKEEIRSEALVRNLSGFARFLPVAAIFHGQVINVAGISRDANVSRTTIAGYLDILEDTLLAFRLPAYEAKLRVRERQHPKLYWIDPGLVRAVKKQYGPLAAEEKGALFEGWIASLLKAYGETRELYDEMFYWAPAEARNTEVDFLLKRGKEFMAIEVKSASSISRHDMRGLRAIGKLGGIVRRLLVYRGNRQLKTGEGIEVWPADKFLECLASNDLWL
jgi:uncharacterized protein